jgi:hypothetical protein
MYHHLGHRARMLIVILVFDLRELVIESDEQNEKVRSSKILTTTLDT